ncbi:MAG: transporter substrate-binding domain-containing protein [Lactobacillales bacterium]|jgi:polar amino acid transport system substrate-binding protein|nr:transporter substrate-binding domain-containing protein [Lactobacillales bacterium]
MKKIMYVLSMIVLLLLIFTGCSNKTKESSGEGKVFRTLDKIKKSKKVIIGVFSDKKPFSYIDEKGNYQGYDVYFANRLGKDLGVKIEYVPTDAANRAEYLKTGKVDIILANFTVTKERKEVVDFSLPYQKVSLGIISPDNALIKDVKDLKSKTLIVAKGTTADTYFTKKHPKIKLLKFEQYQEIFQALLDKRGAAIATDNTEALAWIAKNKGFSVGIKSLGDVDTIAAAVSKGNKTLLDFINEDIEKLAKEQFFHKNFETTLKPVYKNSATPDDIVVEDGKVE